MSAALVATAQRVAAVRQRRATWDAFGSCDAIFCLPGANLLLAASDSPEKLSNTPNRDG